MLKQSGERLAYILMTALKDNPHCTTPRLILDPTTAEMGTRGAAGEILPPLQSLGPTLAVSTPR